MREVILAYFEALFWRPIRIMKIHYASVKCTQCPFRDSNHVPPEYKIITLGLLLNHVNTDEHFMLILS